MWKNLKFSSKTTVLVTVLIAFAVLTAFGYHRLSGKIRDMGIKNSTDTMLQGYKNELKDIVEVMAFSLAAEAENHTSEKDLHEAFTNRVRKARFLTDNSGYFFIYKTGGIVFVHAATPALEGKSLLDLKDPEGTLVIQELEKVSLTGGGFVKYWWEKPNRGLQPKLSYSRMIPGTPYWIGTGVYIDDIKEKEQAIQSTILDYSQDFLLKLYFALGAAFLLVVTPLTMVLIRSIVTPLTRLTHAADEFSMGRLDIGFPDMDRRDEIGKLAKAMERLGTSTKIAMRMMAKP